MREKSLLPTVAQSARSVSRGRRHTPLRSRFPLDASIRTRYERRMIPRSRSHAREGFWAPALRRLLVVSLLPLWGCSLGANRCGPFRVQGGVPCDAVFPYGSVVRITSGWERDGVYRTRNTGTGILVGEKGLILTAAHVVTNPRHVAVLQERGSLYEARPVPDSTLEGLDLALLQISGSGHRAIGGCVLRTGPVDRRFATCAVRTALSTPPDGTNVQVVGYPYNQPRVLRGRVVDPRYRLVRYARESGLNPQSYEELLSEDVSIRPVRHPTDRTRVHIEGMHTLLREVRQGSVFVELTSSRNCEGISGGPVILDGEVIGIVTASWDSFERTILIASPVPQGTLQGANIALRQSAPSPVSPVRPSNHPVSPQSKPTLP